MRGYIYGSIYLYQIILAEKFSLWKNFNLFHVRRFHFCIMPDVNYALSIRLAIEKCIFYGKLYGIHSHPRDSDLCRGWIWCWWLLAVTGIRWGVDEWGDTNSWWYSGNPAHRSSASHSRLKDSWIFFSVIILFDDKSFNQNFLSSNIIS